MRNVLVGLFVVLTIGSLVALPTFGQGDTVLGPDNAREVTLQAALGKGRMLDIGWWDTSTLVTATTTGIWVHDVRVESQSETQLVRYSTVTDQPRATVGPNQVAVAHTDGRVEVYNATGLLVATLQHPGEVWRMTFSTDGQRLYTVANNGTGEALSGANIYRWEIATGTPLSSLPVEQAIYRSIAVSSDEQLVAVGSDNQRLSVLNIDTGGTLWTFSRPDEYAIYSVLTFTEDAKSLLAGVGGGAIVFDADTGTLLADVNTATSGTSTAVFGAEFLDSTHRLLLVVQSRFTFEPMVTGEFWIIDMVNQVNVYEDNSGLSYYDQLAISPDRRQIVYGGYDGYLMLYDVDAGTVRELATGYTATTDILALHPTQPLAATFGYDRMVNVWPLDGDGIPMTIGASHSGGRTALRFDPANGDILLASSDELYRINTSTISNETRTPLEPDGPAGTIYGMRFDPDSGVPQILATSSSGLSLYEAGVVMRRTNLEILDTVLFAAMATDANVFAAHLVGDVLAVGTFDDDLTVIDLKRSADGAAAGIFGLYVNPDGGTILSAYYDGRIGVWTVADDTVNARLLTIADSDVAITSLGAPAVSNGLAAAGTSDGRVLLVDLNAGIVRAILTGHMDDVTSVVFSADGTRLYSSSFDGQILTWGIE